MAYKDSGDLPIGRGYWLGSYSFELRVAHIHEPGEEDVVSVYAICRHINPDMSQESRETQAVDFPEGTKIESWSVEANETEASVYAHVLIKGEESPIPVPINVAHGRVDAHNTGGTNWFVWEYENLVVKLNGNSNNLSGNAGIIYCSAAPGVGKQGFDQWGQPTRLNDYSVNVPYTYNGKTVYYRKFIAGYSPDVFEGPVNREIINYGDAVIAWAAVYASESEDKEEDVLIARFAIDIREAGGGPGGDWDEPGSDGPPDKTLHVTVTGATGGSIRTPPPDRAQAEIYGMGGSGGHGGGGGGGASTVIIFDFATSRAGKVEQKAIARSPGSGGPPGKGGKGGDGCILIFY